MSHATNSNETNDLPRIESVTPVASTKWLALQTLQWKDQDGKDRAWDMATRTTKQSVDTADAVVIIPLLRDPSNPGVVETLLVRQYRPPVRQCTMEFPAGLLDAHETPAQAALRELREETGYIGEACRVVPQVSRAACMSPGLCDETVHVVVVHVDLTNPYNHSPQPQCDEGEHCVVQRVSLSNGFQELLDAATTPMPILGLYLFALGFDLGRTMAHESASATMGTTK